MYTIFDVLNFFIREIGVASTYHAEPKPFYYREVKYWGLLRPLSKFQKLILVFFKGDCVRMPQKSARASIMPHRML